MKKIYYFLTALVLSVSMNSCGEKWLEVQSHDAINIDSYYTTPDRIYQALMAAYDPLQWFDWNGSQYSPVPMVYEVMADDFYPGGSDANDNRHFHLMHNFAAEPDIVVSSIWTVAYSGVNRSNCVHKYMPDVEGIDDATKNEYLAEATVLRTWYYTQMWKLWGNIPYYETNLEFPYICEQSKAEDVYNGMVKALEAAIDSNVLPMKRTSGIGRITQAAAMMLYAEIVLYQNDESRYQKAMDYMDAIITEGGYSLNPDIANMWEQAGEWSCESILEINFYSDGASRSWSNPIYAGGTILPTLCSPEGLEYPEGTVTKYGGADGWGFFPMTEMAANAFEEGDLRKAVTIYNPASEGGTYKARYQDTGNYIAKYFNRADGREGQIADANLNHNNNIRLYRYAETLLNAAELVAVHGCTGKRSADSYLNEVRERAGLGSVAASKATILQERHVELMGEGKRYWDLVRLGEAATVLTPANDLGGYRTNSWTESKKYLPIPQSEIDSAQGTLTQNNY